MLVQDDKTEFYCLPQTFIFGTLHPKDLTELTSWLDLKLQADYAIAYSAMSMYS